jgi:hypothetical protein
MTEYSLHSQIKDWYKISGDKLEAKVEDFVVDILRGKHLIEIQTGNFSAVKKKLAKMLLKSQVRLIYPIAEKKWIVHVSRSGTFLKRRKSPKKGKLTDLFNELVHAPSLVQNMNFSIEVLMIEEEELRCDDGVGSWRRKGISIKDRKLLKVCNRVVFEGAQDFLKFLPKGMDRSFTNKVLAKKLGIPLRLARKISYCLRKMGAISIAGKNGNELVFRISQNPASFRRNRL